MNIITRFSIYMFLIIVLCVNLTGCGDIKPNTPSGLTTVAGDGKVTVSWNVASAYKYRLYWTTTSGGAKTGTRIDPATSPYELTGLTNGTTYYFAVSAVNSDGESDLSSEVSATPTVAVPPPVAPTGVSAIAGTGKATISWSAVADATSYYVYYSSTQANASKANGFRLNPATVTTQDVTGLTAGIWYFVVTSRNANGESAESTPVSASVF